MTRIFHYVSRVQSARGEVGALPSRARTVLLIAAIPGILLIALSMLALLVSILALLLLTVPLYGLLRSLSGGGVPEPSMAPVGVVPSPDGPRKRVEATVVEPSIDRADET